MTASIRFIHEIKTAAEIVSYLTVDYRKRRKGQTMERKPFAMFFNGSPRKNWNTAKVLQSAMKGAEAAGAETELVNLYELKFFGMPKKVFR